MTVKQIRISRRAFLAFCLHEGALEGAYGPDDITAFTVAGSPTSEDLVVLLASDKFLFSSELPAVPAGKDKA